MTENLTWKVPVTVSDLPPTGTEYELVPDKAEREELAGRAGVSAVVSLIARLKVKPEGRGVIVEGVLDATVRQICVVTLDPFENAIRETISLRFVPESSAELRVPETEEIAGEDPPEPLVDGKLDLAPVVAEFLALAVDPYPRKPGAVFAQPNAQDEDGKKESPFAALAALKQPGGKKQ